ncbi:PAS domain-containing protein [Ferrovibrio sp.]|jgi:hypothetical protein|uniref:PAS domain-containing protein n=1 Tax=Ferrovibrio sp. TaxID=1917215 RepID=UPI0035B0A23E
MTNLLPDLVNDGRLSYALACWRRWRGANVWPAREDIDPLDLKNLLPGMYMLESIENGHRFRFTLAGKTVRENLGFELSGKYLDDLFSGPQLAWSTDVHRKVLAGFGHFALQHWQRRGKAVRAFRRLLLPLASDHAHPDMIVGFGLYDQLDRRETIPLDHINDPVTIQIVAESSINLSENPET